MSWSEFPTARGDSSAEPTLTGIIDEPIGRCFEEPRAGEVLFGTAHRAITLTRKLAGGGEGTIWATDRSGCVAKVFLTHRRTPRQLAKIRRMVAAGLPADPAARGICWPLEVLVDPVGRFRGYLMGRAAGLDLQQTLMHPDLFCENCPDWTRRDVVALAAVAGQRGRWPCSNACSVAWPARRPVSGWRSAISPARSWAW